MMEMVQKKSTGFVVQISRLLQNAAFSFTSTADGTPVNITDSENVVYLRLKPLIVPDFLDVKKEILEEQ